MNRTALSIKMLNYLKAHNVVSRSELALYLETNIRNISEFKKELEIAGYCIDTVHGAYGGYRLDEDSLIPTLALSDHELKALNDAQRYLNTHKFKYATQFNEALIKLSGNLKEPTKSNRIHYLASNLYSVDESNMTKMIEEARDQQHLLVFEYKKLNASVWQKRHVQPYECINTDDGYYVLAYDVTPKKTRMFKHFKITPSRMKMIHKMDQTFVRDVDFRLQEHIGKQGLFRDVFDVELEIYGKQANLLYEIEIGLLTKKEMKKGVLHLSFQMENKMRIVEFILSLGFECKVIQPLDIKEEVIKNLEKSLMHYTK